MLGILGSILTVALSIWGIRAIVFKVISERSVGSAAIKKQDAAREKLEEKADETELRIKKLELEIEALKDRLRRTEKHVDGNYDDMKELDAKLEKLRELQNSKIL